MKTFPPEIFDDKYVMQTCSISVSIKPILKSQLSARTIRGIHQVDQCMRDFFCSRISFFTGLVSHRNSLTNGVWSQYRWMCWRPCAIMFIISRDCSGYCNSIKHSDSNSKLRSCQLIGSQHDHVKHTRRHSHHSRILFFLGSLPLSKWCRCAFREVRLIAPCSECCKTSITTRNFHRTVTTFRCW